MSSSPDSNRARILEAACDEFAAVGFAGARVDGIARRAGCNKQLIYHYFGDKNGLFEAVLTEILADRPPMNITGAADLAQNLEATYEHMSKKRAWTRMMMWEALTEDPDGPLVAEEQRRAHIDTAAQDVERLQAAGVFDPVLSPRIVLFAAMALLSAPAQMPHLVRILTGHRACDEGFRRPYLRLVARLFSALAPPG